MSRNEPIGTHKWLQYRGLHGSELGPETRRRAIAMTPGQLKALKSGSSVVLQLPVVSDPATDPWLWVRGQGEYFHLVRVENVDTKTGEAWVGKVVGVKEEDFTHKDEPEKDEPEKEEDDEEGIDTY